MKAKTKILLCSLVLCIGVMATLAFNFNVMPVLAEGETIDPMLELQNQIDQLKETQILGTTIGGIASSIAALLLGWGTNALNKVKMDKALSVSDTSSRLLSETQKVVFTVQNIANDVNEKFEQTTERVHELEKQLEEARVQMDDIINQTNQAVEKSQQSVEMLVSIIGSQPELIANGLAEKVYKAYHKE